MHYVPSLVLLLSVLASGGAATREWKLPGSHSQLNQFKSGSHPDLAAGQGQHSIGSWQPFSLRRLFQQGDVVLRRSKRRLRRHGKKRPGARGTPTGTEGAPTIAPMGTSVAIINQEVFHFEVVAGYMHLLQTLLPNDVTVYLESHLRNRYDKSFGFKNMVLHARHLIHELPCTINRHKVLIFISPEYKTPWVANAIKAAQPKEVIVMVHNGDSPKLPELLKLHDNMRVITLAPHVLHYLEERHAQEGVPEAIKKGAWMLPSWEWQPGSACLPGKLHDCLSGFSIQGKIDVHRRNYTYVFDELHQARSQCQADPKCAERLRDLSVTLLGSQYQRLDIPDRVKESVKCLSSLQYHDFYEKVHHTYALVPALGQEAYYDRKMSSTLISSLITGTPMIVDEKMLQAYPFLSRETTILQPETTRLAEMLLKVMNNSEEELAAVRTALLSLRDQLNVEAQDKLRAILAEHGIATAPPTSSSSEESS